MNHVIRAIRLWDTEFNFIYRIPNLFVTALLCTIFYTLVLSLSG